ncbi:Choline-sulfatase [Anaerohalosphaera lusitana]|uniref:Choline-sulfatase n=1 Tax=Anaerohalosphaera lusitana TaxID=1936003 RepID=A0A1U9NIW8_9BACT|nr:sulfatase [Anaerohalosphaera lusitana]AQT67688.1 Choline-sulfatase [Anaerohalosphaera lusitana]
MCDWVVGRREFLKGLGLGAVCLGLSPVLGAVGGSSGKKGKPNVLFIAVDDLRPELGCYGQGHIKSPNIDRLADTGTLFRRAYCNVPVCGPSRVSLMTGLRVGSGAWKTAGIKREFTSLPAYFKRNGYTAVSNGKIFHHMHDREEDWSREPWRSVPIYHGGNWAKYNKNGLWQDEESGEHINPSKGRGPYYECADVEDDAYQDGKLAEKAVRDMRELASADEPFFLACGFWRPHLPLNAPKKYWDMYDAEEIELADNRFRPKNLPKQVRNSGEIFQYSEVREGFNSYEFHRRTRHAYYACVSYVDAQIGKLLDELDRLGIADNTIVVLWGDHGWHLGEHDFWGKHNTLNNALQSPLIVRDPRGEAGATDSLAEFVDVYPTLCELAGVAVPDHLDGKSLAGVMKDTDVRIHDAVFARWGDAVAMKTDRYLYTEWVKGGETTGRMLFDHKNDPEENINIAEKPENAELVKRLSGKVHEHLRILSDK